jgi:hypothetical protein
MRLAGRRIDQHTKEEQMPRYATTDRPFALRRRRGAVVDDGPGVATEGAWTLARLVDLVAGIVAMIIVAGIALVLLEANAANTFVNAVLDAGRWLVGPFKDVFSFSNHKTQIGVNWGIAAVVYLVVGHLISGALRRLTAPTPVD